MEINTKLKEVENERNALITESKKQIKQLKNEKVDLQMNFDQENVRKNQEIASKEKVSGHFKYLNYVQLTNCFNFRK